MKIIGTEGLDAATIRNKVEQGARFVYFNYCISLLVVTLRRSSPVYFIKAGHSRVGRGAPYSLISMVLGWWGLPWGPIYTMEALSNNFTGGTDMTNQILAALPSAHGGPAGLPRPPPMPVPVFHAGTGRKILVGVVVVAGLVTTLISGICFYKSAHLPVVLISGATATYTVQLNGTHYTLKPNEALVLSLGEGDYTLSGGPVATPQTLHFALPFLDHLAKGAVAVINPDRRAIFYLETTGYYKESEVMPVNEKFDYSVYANQISYFLPKADYVFEDFPQKIDLPSDVSRVTKNRFQLLATGSQAERAELLRKRADYATMARHLEIVAPQEAADEGLLQTAFALLKPADGRALFAAHLGDRPLPVEWHRYYQDYMQRYFQDFDLVQQYRAFSAAEPANGALLYLLARISDDPAESKRLNEQALAVAQPCAYAYGSLGFDYLNQGDFAHALASFQEEERRGVHSGTLQYNLRAAQLGLHHYAELAASTTARRQNRPQDLALAAEEITLTLLSGNARAEADKLQTAYLAAFDRATHPTPAERAQVAAFLSATIAYGVGDGATFARENAKIGTPNSQFEAAITLGDHAAAAALLKDIPAENASVLAWLDCYLAAKLKGDDAAAEPYFSRAVEIMRQDDHRLRQLAADLQGSMPPALAKLTGLAITPEQKRIILAALALRYPEHRAALLPMVKALNIEPGFPRLLIDQVMNSGAPSA